MKTNELIDRVSIAYWHDTFVEVKKPNSDLIYRFKLNDVCEHGVDDGACKECYLETTNLQAKIDNLYENNARLDAEIEALKKQCSLLQEGYNAQAILLGVDLAFI